MFVTHSFLKSSAMTSRELCSFPFVIAGFVTVILCSLVTQFIFPLSHGIILYIVVIVQIYNMCHLESTSF